MDIIARGAHGYKKNLPESRETGQRNLPKLLHIAYSNPIFREEDFMEQKNYIVRIHRPSLTPEERERRMKNVILAAERILREQEEVHRETAVASGG